MMKKVIIADDHPIFLLGLKTLLASISQDYVITGEASSTDELMQMMKSEPDILITDFSMPAKTVPDGIALIRSLRRSHPNVVIIVITMLTNPGLLASIAQLGVHGVISKNRLSIELKQVLDKADKPLRRTEKPAVVSLLTAREMEVVRLLFKGMNVNDISVALNRTKQTISAQKISAMKKMGARNDVELFQCAIQMGLDS